MRTMTGAMVMALAMTAAAQNNAEEARRKLAAQKISVHYEKASLDDAVAFLRDATGLNFHLDATVAEHAPDATVRLKLRDVSVRTVLKLMLQPHDLSAVWRNGAIVILPRRDAVGNRVMRIYDIRAQLLQLPDFPGPKVELVESTSEAPLTGVVFDLDEAPQVPIPGDMLVDLVRMNTGGASWDDDPDVSIDLANGHLIVTQSPAVHREISRLLRKLEQYR